MKSILQLGASRYEVRNEEGSSRVLCEEGWLFPIAFVNWLFENQRREELLELIEYGIQKRTQNEQ